jgi:hypothetical protein
MAAASATVNAPADVSAGGSSNPQVGAVRSDGGRQSAVPPRVNSELRFGEVRASRDGDFGLLVSHRPIIETTAETSSEISSQSSSIRPREVEGGGRSGERGREERYALRVSPCIVRTERWNPARRSSRWECLAAAVSTYRHGDGWNECPDSRPTCFLGQFGSLSLGVRVAAHSNPGRCGRTRVCVRKEWCGGWCAAPPAPGADAGAVTSGTVKY